MKKMAALFLTMVMTLASATIFTSTAHAKKMETPCGKMDGKKQLKKCKLDMKPLVDKVNKKKKEGFKTEEQDWMKK